MADYDRRPRGNGGGYGGNRKRRYRGEFVAWEASIDLTSTRLPRETILTYSGNKDEDDFDRRPQRRRYEEPLSSRMRKQLLSIAESPLRRVEDEVSQLAKLISENHEETELCQTFFDLAIQIVLEQPFKIPFVAAVVVVLNGLNKGEEAVQKVLSKAAVECEKAIATGDWRAVKLLCKFLGSLQGVLEDEGIWSVLGELFERAVDLQTASSDDVSISLL